MSVDSDFLGTSIFLCLLATSLLKFVMKFVMSRLGAPHIQLAKSNEGAWFIIHTLHMN